MVSVDLRSVLRRFLGYCAMMLVAVVYGADKFRNCGHQEKRRIRGKGSRIDTGESETDTKSD